MSTTYNPTTQSFGNITLPSVTGYGSSAIYVGGGGGGTWSTTATNATWGSATQASLSVDGNAVFKNKVIINTDLDVGGDVKVGGVSITTLMRDIQARLGILVPNPALEAEFEELKAIGEQYRQLEAKCAEQQQIYQILKKTDE